MNFKELNLNNKILLALEKAGYSKATAVQESAIPEILKGNDVVVRSQTGSGKTMAYVLPIVQNIEISNASAQALIICPTRELAIQVADEMLKITEVVEGVRVVAVYGGSDIGRQIKALKRKPQIIVGTPGRLMDHMDRKTLKLHELKTIVLDEADEMLNMGFKEDIETILKATPKDRQTLLFSATYPQSIRQITKNYQTNAVNIEVGDAQRSLENIKQYYVIADRRNKKEAFIKMFSMLNPKTAIVFCNTKRMAEEVHYMLKDAGVSSEFLHGDMRQSARKKVMMQVKSGQKRVLVGSDVLARGIDIDNVDFVINYDLPTNVEYFLHRIGRTARAGKKGTAVTIVNTRDQLQLLKEFEKQTQSNMEEIVVKVFNEKTKSSEISWAKSGATESASRGREGGSRGRSAGRRDSSSSRGGRDGGRGRDGSRGRDGGRRDGAKSGSRTRSEGSRTRSEGSRTRSKGSKDGFARKSASGKPSWSESPEKSVRDGGRERSFEGKSSDRKRSFEGKSSDRKRSFGSQKSNNFKGEDKRRSERPFGKESGSKKFSGVAGKGAKGRNKNSDSFEYGDKKSFKGKSDKGARGGQKLRSGAPKSAGKGAGAFSRFIKKK